MKIDRALSDEICAHALSGYPYEVCGVMLGRAEGGVSRVERVVRVTNREPETPKIRYQIAPKDLIRIQREGREAGHEILGYYHSHPDHPARPSETDRRIAAEGLSDGVIHVVVGVDAGREATPKAWIFQDATQGFEEEALEIV